MSSKKKGDPKARKSQPHGALKGRDIKAQGKKQRDAALGHQPPIDLRPEGAGQTPGGWMWTTLG